MIDVDTIAQALAPAVSELGLDLYDVDVSGSGRARILRVMVDREGGVDLEAIADATQAVSPLLDAPPLDAVIAGPYALEVSSPGLERPLRTPAHFARAVGETISVKTRPADDHGGPARARCHHRGRRHRLRAAARRRHGASTSPTATSPRRARCSSGATSPSARSPPKSKQRAPREPLPKRTGTAMNSEMMEALENIEREKGISIEIMLEALANALLTAYKRMPDAAEEALVEIDMETGAIKVIAQELDEDGNVTREWDDTPTDFGRIAAQTAKQVIFQRIREAEREMKYEEYAGREGDIVTGIIQQTDARYTLLDLGKVEALLPQAEQVQNEHYDHGSRLKAYIVEVRKTAKGPQIVVSRTHPGLVKRLFELEVPEIVDGVVELKAIAREPGHRTKLAVVVQRQQRRPRRRVRRRARFARAHGRQRAARREGRHRPLQRRPVGVRDEGARAGARARGAHPPRHRHRRGHRPRLPAVARDRQGGPERPPRRAPHRLARRHQERGPARRKRSPAAASSTPRASGSPTTSASSCGSRPRAARRSRPPRRATRRRRPTPQPRRPQPTRRRRRTGRRQLRRRQRRSAPAPRPRHRNADVRETHRQRPPAETPGGRTTRRPRQRGGGRRRTRRDGGGRRLGSRRPDPSAPASGVGGWRPSEELVRIRAVPTPSGPTGLELGAGPGRGAWLCRSHPAACLDEAQRRRTVERALRIRDTE